MPKKKEIKKFPQSPDNWFNFSYDFIAINQINLTIKGFNYGSVWGTNSVNVYYFDHGLDGICAVTLTGYYDGIELVSDTRSFHFNKIKDYFPTLFEHNFTYIGNHFNFAKRR